MKWGVGLLVVLVALSGCLSDGDEASAKDLSGEMNDEARSWRGGAFPVLALGLESSEPYNMTMQMIADDDDFVVDDTTLVPLPGDPTVGNGRTTGWLSMYLARGSDQALGQIVAADGERLAVERFPLGVELPDDFPKSSWGDVKIDSPRAIGIARDIDGWPDITNDDRSFNAFILMFEPGEGAGWLVSSGVMLSETDVRVGFAIISAATGELLVSEVADASITDPDAEGFFTPYGGGTGPMGAPTQAGGTIRAQHSILQPSAVSVGGFELAAGHPDLVLSLDMPDHLPLAAARATIVSPEGDEHELTFAGPVLGQGSAARLELADPAPGPWMVNLQMTRGIMETIELKWCADGMPADGPVAECAELLVPEAPTPSQATLKPSGWPRVTAWPDLGSVPSAV